ncbi:SPFH domain-containing protein [Altererythrobacter sp. KTW20L]|uniref:SPFH domain-containing protein n=1 Tax=Altererythrobacter sp. KTW20L TaxID=2942210 RepID=UPI0020BF3A9E|nr:SPFH domain-containing protein [Altererythrobacter sp. KTW20L]MCL6250178.1 SPFH domain-containing protein [Altererythrobacter sp. KTW20L]
MAEISLGMNTSKERSANTYNGYVMLLTVLALVLWILWRFVLFGTDGPSLLGIISLPVSVLAILFVLLGFYMIQPNQGAVITLFGDYRGTDRKTGLHWVWPWMGRKKISMRAHNIHSERVKINDLRGNPVEIACNVVWRVSDTAQAVFDVDDYKQFVNIQIEAALRTVGARHPYDDMSEEDETTLRGSADVINAELQAELNDRLRVAGIVVDEAGLTHLAYAPEIAGAMLRRQQAEAVIAARAKLVLGAVSMVEMALEKLSADNIVHLDDERKAAMVSNLMVVLVGDRDTQPVVNTGTLYQ